MKRKAPMLPWSRLLIAPLCVVLVLAVGLATAPPAQAQGRGNDLAPSKLWKTYPLDPSKGRSPIRKTTEPEPQRVSPPTQRVAPPTQPSQDGARDTGDPRGLEPLTVSGLAFLGLLLLLVGTVPIVRKVASVHHPLARVGSAVAFPVRAVASVPRHKPRLRWMAATEKTVLRSTLRVGRWAPGSRLAFRTSRRRSLTNFWSARAPDGASLTAVRRIVSRFGSDLTTALGHGVRFLLSLRYQIALYAFAALVAASLGVAVALLLGGD